MTKVLIVQEYVPAYREPFFRTLRSAAENEGIELILAAGEPGSELRARKDSVLPSYVERVPQREFKVLGRRVTLRSLRRVSREVDVVVLEQARRNIELYWFLLKRLFGGPRVALWGHGRDFVKTARALDARLLSCISSRADWFFAYTEEGRRVLVRQGFPSSRITVLRNSTDTRSLRGQWLAQSEESVQRFKAKYGLRESTAIFVGALEESKRVRLLLDAASDVARHDSNFRLLIVGDGPLRDVVTRESLKSPWVVPVGPLRGADLALALKSAQILAIPGRVGLVAADSFATERPIVTLQSSRHAPEFEYLQSGMNAVVVDRDVNYARAISDVLSSPHLLRELQAGCRASAPEYSIEEMSERFINGLIQLVKGVNE